MARPKRPPESRRKYHIGVRLDESEYGKILGDSEKIGVTVSEYVRAKALRGFIRIPKYAKIDARNIALLSKLTGLFKKSYTDTGGVYANETAAILSEIRAILLKMNREFGNDREAYNEEPKDA